MFVAAGCQPASASARLLAAVAEGRLARVWDAATRAETAAVLARTPRLDPAASERLLRPEHEHPGPLDLSAFGFVEDPEDRKFAALAAAAGALLVSSDAHLLAHRGRLEVATPAEAARRLLG